MWSSIPFQIQIWKASAKMKASPQFHLKPSKKGHWLPFKTDTCCQTDRQSSALCDPSRKVQVYLAGRCSVSLPPNGVFQGLGSSRDPCGNIGPPPTRASHPHGYEASLGPESGNWRKQTPIWVCLIFKMPNSLFVGDSLFVRTLHLLFFGSRSVESWSVTGRYVGEKQTPLRRELRQSSPLTGVLTCVEHPECAQLPASPARGARQKMKKRPSAKPNHHTKSDSSDSRGEKAKQGGKRHPSCHHVISGWVPARSVFSSSVRCHGGREASLVRVHFSQESATQQPKLTTPSGAHP